MAAKDDGKTDDDWHAKIMCTLHDMLPKKNLKALKHALETTKRVSHKDVEEADDFYDLWKKLEQRGQISVGKYDGLIIHLEMLKFQDCVEVIEDHRSKIEEYRKGKAQTNPAYSTSQNNAFTMSLTNHEKKQTTLPPRERQPVRESHQPNSRDVKAENGRPADKYIVEDTVVATELAQVSQAPGGDFERKSKLAHPSLRNDYEDVPPPIDPKKMCSYCSKQPSRGYFKPCGHSVACVSCSESKIQNTNRTGEVLYCPKCSIAVKDYKRPCEVCLVNQVHGYVKPCGHSVACYSCVTNASTAGVSLRCPQCGNFVADFKNTCLICLEGTVTGFLTPCGHLAACYDCTTKMLQRYRAYCPDCKQEVHDYKTSQFTSF